MVGRLVQHQHVHALRHQPRQRCPAALAAAEVAYPLVYLVAHQPEPAQQAELWYAIGHASAMKYDGEGFVAAMEKALELGAEEGLVYSELAHQTMSRYGMWQRQLDNDLVEAWIARALAATAEGSPARVKALAANADWHEDLNSARAALALAEELGDVELRSTGLGSGV